MPGLCKAPVDEPPTKFPSVALMDSDVHPLSLPSHVLPNPQRGASLTEPRKESCSLSGALQLSLKVPSQRTESPGSPTGPYGETRLSPELSSTTFPQSPRWISPPPCSPTGSLWRETLHLQSQWFIPTFVSVRVPNKEPSREKRGKHLVTVHGAPRGRKAYIQ